MLGQLIVQEDIRLPALIDRARSRLAEARTSAEVLEARAAAKAALHYAKLLEAANETQADCLSIIKRAELRMADEIDAAQRLRRGRARRRPWARHSIECPRCGHSARY